MLGSSYWASTSSVINDATSGSSQEIKQRIEEPTLIITTVLVPLKFGGIQKLRSCPKVGGGMPIYMNNFEFHSFIPKNLLFPKSRSTCETEGKRHVDGQVGANMSVVG